MEFYPFNWKLRADILEIHVRLSIFTIISACAGLPALVWSVSDLIHHRKNGHRISVFIILLLLTDFVELLLSPYILLKDLLETGYWDLTYKVLSSLLWTSSLYGVLLNQLVALEGILSVKYLLYTACVFTSPCFVIFYTLVFLCIFIGHLVLKLYHIFFVVLLLVVPVITWIISCGASCRAGRHSHTSGKADHHIVVVFIFTLLVFYLPYILVRFFVYFVLFLPQFLPVWLIPSFTMSMRLISDPLLCVLVCRQNLRISNITNS